MLTFWLLELAVAGSLAEHHHLRQVLVLISFLGKHLGATLVWLSLRQLSLLLAKLECGECTSKRSSIMELALVGQSLALRVQVEGEGAHFWLQQSNKRE